MKKIINIQFDVNETQKRLLENHACNDSSHLAVCSVTDYLVTGTPPEGVRSSVMEKLADIIGAWK